MGIKMKGGLIKYFHDLRFNKNHHLGLGDIRLTIGQQKEICKEWAKMNKKLLQSESQNYCKICGNILDGYIPKGD